jgi:Fe-S cluster assembly protein SufB
MSSTPDINVERDVGDFHYDTNYEFDAGVGLSEQTIDYIVDVKGEDDWVRTFRKKALKTFREKPNPTHWASKDIENIDYDKIRYYLSKGQQPSRSWDEVPDEVKKTFERLGIPEKERAFLAGVEAQFDSEASYSNMKEELAKDGVIFMGSTDALKEHPELFRKWFGKVIPIGDNKFSALNSAVFSGGSFIYIPPGVKVKQPLQAYFRINAENFGQFERTLIIADEGAELTYMEGCTAPKFETTTLHSAVVELVAMKGAKIQYITVQNWSANVFDGQHQDTGAKMVHAADNTTSNIISKSISIGEGRSTYRGVVTVPRQLKGCKNNTECDALLINTNSRTDTYPAITVKGNQSTVQHEASVSKVSAEQIFYMMQRGLPEGEAMSLAVNGFVNDLIREFPMEYSVELKRLIDLEMEGSVG